jgi:hypothetical protein
MNARIDNLLLNLLAFTQGTIPLSRESKTKGFFTVLMEWLLEFQNKSSIIRANGATMDNSFLNLWNPFLNLHF